MTKMKLSLANTIVAVPGYLFITPVIGYELIPFLLATQMMAMSTQTANQAIEVQYDKIMLRTCRRPLPQEKIDKNSAKIISLALFSISNLIFYKIFPLSGLMIANSIFFSYVFLYTPMKRLNSYNTLIGAIIGALPPYLGWACGGGSLLALNPLLQFLYMFSWQFGHFYGILFRYKTDYSNAGFKMVEDPQEAVKQMKITFFIGLASFMGIANQLSFNAFYIGEVLSALSMYQWGWVPLKQFEKDPSTEEAKRMKINSYKHFTIFWILIYIDLFIIKYFSKDSKQELEQSQQPINQDSQSNNQLSGNLQNCFETQKVQPLKIKAD